MRFARYSKELLELAKKTGQYLVTVEFIRPSGKPDWGSQGPMTIPQARIVSKALLKALELRHDEKKSKSKGTVTP